MNFKTKRRPGLRTLVFACVLLTAGHALALTQYEIQKLLSSDGVAGAQFGSSVALDGDTAVVGAFLDVDNGYSPGSAHVFTRDGAGLWTLQTKLLSSDGADFDWFGVSVALDGDTAVIGANSDDDLGSSSGSAYVFTRDHVGLWTQQSKLVASDGAGGDQFGFSVALDGDTAVLGAHGRDELGVNSGSAYVFTRDHAGLWTEQAKLLASDGKLTAQFGWSVALDGDTVVIGAQHDDELGFNSGSAYVFTRDHVGLWTEQAKLLASDGKPNAQFGWSVALDGDTVVIGAAFDDELGSSSGSAYVFTRDHVGLWTEQAKLLASDHAAGYRFGVSASLEGDTAVVGAPLNNDSGRAYVFTRDGAGLWTEQATLLASDGATIDRFGYSVDISGQTAIVGATLHDAPSTNQGAAYLFSLANDGEGPLTSNVLANPSPVAAESQFSITGLVDDTDTGGSSIAGATYTLNGAGPYHMSASDGTFDEVAEYVIVTWAGGLPAGVYDVCVTGTDSNGNVGNTECTLLAVYDPNAGFVTGGGWIDSPAGAYVADPALVGQAKFGFVSKYNKGKNVPTGITQFQFKAASLNFHSDTYEWLIVAGARAQYKGVGTINGSGNYGFMLTAIDAALTPSTNVDRFRIKIWDKENADILVYDNELGSDDSSTPSTAIGGGSIVIHIPKN